MFILYLVLLMFSFLILSDFASEIVAYVFFIHVLVEFAAA